MEAYARLKALRDNIPKVYVLEAKYVDEFHKIIGLLQKNSTHDLANFKVTAEAMKHGDSKGRYDTNLVLAKIDALLNFFEIKWSDPKPFIGFRPQ
jgi:hypothetical protein